jgi:site-specific DNA-methyltransferase (adenine-specific)
VTLHHGDCLDVLHALPDGSVEACVTDPPYGLAFMGKRWDYDVPSVGVWREVFRVLTPGAHLLAFFGTRTYHRGVIAIEDAGFEIRDQLAWVYGSGFPKSHNLGNGWGTALKPAHEPIVLARKPLIGTVVENVQQYGTGAIHVDACRVEAHDGTSTARKPAMVHRTSAPFGAGMAMGGNGSPLGRWPANILHDGSEDVVGLFPQSTSTGGEPLSGEVNRHGIYRNRNRERTGNGCGLGDTGSAARFFYCAKASKRDRDEGLEGFADRIATVGNLEAAGRDASNPGNYIGGQQRRVALGLPPSDPRKNHHPTVKPTALMRWLVRLITPPGGTVLDPFMGSGSTGKACALEGFGFIGIEREAEYLEIARARIAAAATDEDADDPAEPLLPLEAAS